MLFRSIKRSVEQRILEKGRKYKNTLQIDGRKDAETFVAYTSWHQPGIEKSDIRAMCQRVPELSGAGPLSLPLRSHMGNLQQALSYGGILVKFYIRRDRASLLTKEYLADGGSVAGGSQGNTTNNKIGTKQEGRGGDFSFNLGDNFWASLLFLSTVEKYEGFDLRKQEGAATLPGSLPPAW